jgi:tetratricopeptide (TPR) repeat protein
LQGGPPVRPELRAECDLEAGEIALQDLLRDDEAKKRLDTATTSLGPSTSRLGSVLQRLRGDYHARQGDQTAAMAAYARAVRLHESKANVTEAQARRGARSRSVEAFLREGDNERALVELRRWRDEDPAAAIEGYWPFLMARAQQARKHYDRAIALAGDHLALAPDSPYADQIAFLAAESEEKQGRAEPAAARYRTFLTDYPGSPLAPAARKKLEGAKTKRAQER